MSEIEALAGKLGISEKELASMRLKFARAHGAGSARMLERHLRKLWAEKRDRVRLLGRKNGYVESARGAMAIFDPDSESAAFEPEAVSGFYQDVLVIRARHRRAQLETSERAEELARAQIRSITEMLRSMVIEAARTGADINPLLSKIASDVKSEYERAA